ncbi:ankyrin repeat domain-containing protein [Mesorhizobium sp. LMG 17147]|uniref:ankyrin repeat domain-containing protein n=1 Tax=Mesorhizobium sp. LMG 17147 TaxID=2963091 RepID=UPI0020C9CB6E|nr:ankyrin repeat domain-containing protein [Mesorhizobium sp. LMG 17147]MCP9234138.1 ankyrin repeat domain-containing protein [Mesorhizobium sp. LMG 17147]
MRMPLLFIPLLLAHIPIVSHAADIHDAAKKGDVAAIAAALDAGAGVDESDGHATPLYLAVRGGHFAAAKLLMERGADVNAVPDPRLGPALMLALAKRRIDLINLLLDGGANPNSHRARENALHIAVRSGCLDCVKALVESGADVNAKTKDGKTPLHLAKFTGQREVADYLMSHGVVLPTPAPISMKLATADVEKGRTYFTRVCHGCHNAEPQGGSKTGPNLWSVVGRDKASMANMRYSDTLLGWEGVWTYEDLNRYLFGPMLTTPGVKMETPGVPDETERVNLIAYLRTLSDKPVPLP